MDSARVPGADMEIVEQRIMYAVQQMRSIHVWRDVPILFCPRTLRVQFAMTRAR